MVRRLGYWMYRWHAWAGLISGVFLIIICVSGSVAVFKPELQRALDWGDYKFNVVPAGQPITPAQALAAAESHYPGRNISTLHLPALPGTIYSHGPTYAVRVGGNKQTPAVDALVDPYLGKVVAETRLNQGWGQWLRQLHLRLLYGSFWGRWVVGFFGIVLTFAVISGLVIYTRFNAGQWKPKLRLNKGSRILWADLHKLVGIGALAFNLIFGITGAVLGLETLYARYANASTAPTTQAAQAAQAVQTVQADDAKETDSADAQDRKAKRIAALPEGMLESCIAQASVLIPGSTPSAVDLQHKRNGTIRVRVEHPASALIAENKSSVTFNASTGEAIRVRDASRSGAAERLYLSMEPLHFGRLGGWMWVKLLWGLRGRTGGILSISGYAIYVLRWWKKKRPSRVVVPTERNAPAAIEPACAQ